MEIGYYFQSEFEKSRVIKTLRRGIKKRRGIPAYRFSCKCSFSWGFSPPLDLLLRSNFFALHFPRNFHSILANEEKAHDILITAGDVLCSDLLPTKMRSLMRSTSPSSSYLSSKEEVYAEIRQYFGNSQKVRMKKHFYLN